MLTDSEAKSWEIKTSISQDGRFRRLNIQIQTHKLTDQPIREPGIQIPTSKSALFRPRNPVHCFTKWSTGFRFRFTNVFLKKRKSWDPVLRSTIYNPGVDRCRCTDWDIQTRGLRDWEGRRLGLDLEWGIRMRRFGYRFRSRHTDPGLGIRV